MGTPATLRPASPPSNFATRPLLCSSCGKSSLNFSHSQVRKAAGIRRCTPCITATAETAPTSSRHKRRTPTPPKPSKVLPQTVCELLEQERDALLRANGLPPRAEVAPINSRLLQDFITRCCQFKAMQSCKKAAYAVLGSGSRRQRKLGPRAAKRLARYNASIKYTSNTMSTATNTVPRQPSIRAVFHGTPSSNVQSILEHGLLIPGTPQGNRAGVQMLNGCAYGSGVYTSTAVNMSRAYMRAHSQMFICGLIDNVQNVYCTSQILVVQDASLILPLWTVTI